MHGLTLMTGAETPTTRNRAPHPCHLCHFFFFYDRIQNSTRTVLYSLNPVSDLRVGQKP